MSNQQQQRQGFKNDLNLFIAVCQCLAYLGEAWLRKPGTAGSRYFSGQAFIGWCLLLIIAAFGQSPPHMNFWLATGLLFLVHKLGRAVQDRRGKHEHSRFVGVSFLSFLGGNRLAVRLWEPVLTFIVGVVLMQNGHGYGGSIVVLSFCLVISSSYIAASEKAMVTAMRDAKADQAWLMELARKD